MSMDACMHWGRSTNRYASLAPVCRAGKGLLDDLAAILCWIMSKYAVVAQVGRSLLLNGGR